MKGQYAPLLQGTWDGDWVNDEGFLFTFKMELEVKENQDLEAKIDWLLVKYPESREDYDEKVGKRAVEWVRGKALQNKIFLQGYRRQDAHQIIGLDEYELTLDCAKQTLEGVTFNGGNWKGKVFALRRITDTLKCFPYEQLVHYCHTLSLNINAYPDAKSRAIYYEWMREYLACQKIDLYYFHLPEWDWDTKPAQTQAADTGQKPSKTTSNPELISFQEEFNKNIFATRMFVARQIIGLELGQKQGEERDEYWIRLQEKNSQNFLETHSQLINILPSINQALYIQSQETRKPNFWKMVKEQLPSSQKLDFRDSIIRRQWQMMYLKLARNP